MSIFNTLFGSNVQNSTSSAAGGGIVPLSQQGLHNQATLSKAAAQANAAQQMAMNGYNQQMNAMLQNVATVLPGNFIGSSAQQAFGGGLTAIPNNWQTMQHSVTGSGVYGHRQPDGYPNYNTRESLEADPLAMADISVLMDLWRARFGDDWVGIDRLGIHGYEKEETRDFKTIYERLDACRKLERVNTDDKGALWRIIS
jgi:hypothetical protein